MVARYVPVTASRSGVVTFVGVAGGYGKLIKIKHSDGYETRYAHLNRIDVKKGQKVSQGQSLGQSGMTGRVTGPHLHFEVRKNGKPVNPMKYNRIDVKKGQKVSQGQSLGQSGMTGRVTGPHLHFEVRKNGKPVNPMKYLKR